jgi:hypothetical protein
MTKEKFHTFLVGIFLLLFVFGRSDSLLHPYSHQDLNSDKTKHCLTCSLSNFASSGGTLEVVNFAVTTFLLLIILREFTRVKPSYILSSRSPRAPPVIS